jgi:hypothetical protein
MLVIRKAQIEALTLAKWRNFERTAYRHCRECFPEVCDRLGENGVWRYVYAGLDRAKRYGFSTAAEYLKYLTLMMTAGPDFDKLPWAAEILDDPQYLPGVRIQILIDTAANELSRA